jgi:dihydropteroate synthase
VEEGDGLIRPKRYYLRLGDHELQFGDRTLIMGILNVTPDSFTDGGSYLDPDRAAERALELQEQGADIIDIGAESTRPGAERISEAEELHRLIPVLKRLKGQLTIPISVDTYKSAVAQKALENGAVIINDPSTLTFDSELARVVAAANGALILNHMRGTPETWAKLGNLAHPMKAVMEDLDAGISRARRAGIDRSRILLDPGLGFGKRGEQNYELIARLGEMQSFDLPIVVGPSRKSFLGQSERENADIATGAAVTAAVMNGAHVVRVHNVLAIRPALQTADGILRSLREAAEAPEPAEPKARKSAAPFRLAGPNTEGKPLRPPGPRREPPTVPHPPAEEQRPIRPPRRDDDRGDDRRPPRKRFDQGAEPPRRFARENRPFDPDRPPPRERSGRPDRDRPQGDRPPPRKRFGGPERFEGDRPAPRKRAGGPDRDRPQGDRPPPRKRFGGPERFEGDRPAPRKRFGGPDRGGPPGDRPPRRFDRDREGGSDRPPFKRSFSGGGPGKKPFKRSGGPPRKGAKRPGGGRPPRPRRDD